RIFEPFFTTKEKGKGTGLGLATVYGVIKQSGGYIWVESEPGNGAKFEIFLPRIEGQPRELSPPAAPKIRTHEQRTVLVAEDEPSLLKLTHKLLARLGYSVLEAPNGEEALKVANGFRGKIDLLLTDVVMPGMGGPVLAQMLAASRPDTKILFMSGYTDGAIADRGVLDEGVFMIRKPFTQAQLTRSLDEIFDEQSSAETPPERPDYAESRPKND
ncbi:MAG TPA: response regulator, partial [Candidatus Acidoferrales bacterium]|nr:response regulator [Candidatus Acidoferrales bacterium]